MVNGVGVVLAAFGRHVVTLTGFADVTIDDDFAVEGDGDVVAFSANLLVVPRAQRLVLVALGRDDAIDRAVNLIFTQTEQMSLEGRMPSPLYNRNKNVLVIGGSGSGKTRFYAKPNLMQLNCSYVFTDPKGTVLEECGYMLRKHGYKIKVLNTINFSKSMKYNPFAYIKKETDIPVRGAKDPLSCVALGTGKYLEFLSEGKFRKNSL